MTQRRIVKITSIDPYTKNDPSMVRFGLCDDAGHLLGSHTCREIAASTYRGSLDQCSTSKYWILFSHTKRGKALEKMSELVNANVDVLNSIEARCGFRPTTVEMFDGYSDDGGQIGFMEKSTLRKLNKNIIPTVFEFTMDELWLSAPPLMSLHMLINRLNNKTPAAGRIYHDFEDVKLDIDTENFMSKDSSYFRDYPFWEVLLYRIFEVFPTDRTYNDNWLFCKHGSAAGISRLVSGDGEDSEAIANLGRYCSAC